MFDALPDRAQSPRSNRRKALGAYTVPQIDVQVSRTPQPCRISGSMVLLKVAVPKFRLLMTPQKSPAGAEVLRLRVAQVAVGRPVAVARRSTSG